MKPIERYDIFDPELQKCPFPYYKELRDNNPVHWDARLGVFVVSRFGTIQSVAKNIDVFSNMDTVFNPQPSEVADRVEAIRAMTYPAVPMLVANDPPSHSQYRKIFTGIMTVKRMSTASPLIETLTTEFLDRALARGGAEFVGDYAIPLPIAIIASLLGVPQEDWGRCKQWSDAYIEPIIGGITPEREIECANLFVERQRYFADALERREGDPAAPDDILTGVANATLADGTPVPMPEKLAMVEQYLIAGNESSSRALSMAMLTLCERSDLLETLHRGPEKINVFVEEILRLFAPIQGFFRTVKSDTDLEGVSIPKGSKVMIRWGSGNRDDRFYPRAEEIDLDRKSPRNHLTFGHGIHMCAGAPLARQELQILTREVARRVATLAVDPDAREPQYWNGIMFMGLSELHVRLTGRP